MGYGQRGKEAPILQGVVVRTIRRIPLQNVVAAVATAASFITPIANAPPSAPHPSSCGDLSPGMEDFLGRMGGGFDGCPQKIPQYPPNNGCPEGTVSEGSACYPAPATGPTYSPGYGYQWPN
jgi:hypothetical protein